MISPYRNSELAIEHALAIINRDRPEPDRYPSAQVFASLAVANAILALVEEARVIRSILEEGRK